MVIGEDDIVVILFGGVVPYIIRLDGDTYAYIVECYSMCIRMSIVSCLAELPISKNKENWSHEVGPLGWDDFPGR
jgi:hypothetical protein